MKRMHLVRLALLGGAFLALTSDLTQARPAAIVQIGAMKSLFRDAPDSLVTTLARPLRTLMEAQTGMSGDLKVVPDAGAAATMLESRELHIAVMHGFEYGWARKANPKLRALVMASRLTRDTRFALVVRKDCTAKTVTELKDGKLAVPFLTKEPAHLFLEVKCCTGTAPNKFFRELTTPTDGEEALDDVATRAVPVALVEKTTLEVYTKAKPKLASNLKVLLLSEDFPAGVFVYREGHLSDDMLQRLRNGLVGASTNPRSKELLKLAKIAGFETVPANFDAQIEELVKAYPTPLGR